MLMLNIKDKDFSEKFNQFLTLRTENEANVDDVVASILADVKKHGDDALIKYTNKFDRFALKQDALRILEEDILKATCECSDEALEALKLAADRIKSYHERQMPSDMHYTDAVGVHLGAKWTAVESAGLYVPGGTAAYPSSVLMNAIPAKVAGVERLVMVVPTPDGKLNPLVLAAAHIAGVDEVYRVGGAQAVAALAYGTEAINPVCKIVGPGNAYVASAKKQVFGAVGIDMIAGPSEILVITDNKSNPEWVAVDLLSQAEHDTMAQSILITDDADYANVVIAEVENQLKMLPREEIARKSWENLGGVIIVDNLYEDVASIVNEIAPEHCEVCVDDPYQIAGKIRNAGALFLGRYTPEAVGDYVGGPNHVLPTVRTARFSSPLGVLDFMKRTSILNCDEASINEIGHAAVTLAEIEGLHAHGKSVALRLSNNN
ncbi:MAG: histidinol dehydrogenase [Alphaproteobacteria bacterium]|nr:histidinol dehydrogenase [Alphaproteobacteria bacterium]